MNTVFMLAVRSCESIVDFHNDFVVLKWHRTVTDDYNTVYLYFVLHVFSFLIFHTELDNKINKKIKSSQRY